MTFYCTLQICFVLMIHSRAVNLLESVDELICQEHTIGTQIPHPEFCNVYIVCLDDNAMQISCEGRMLYNPEAETCDPHYSTCPGGLVKTQDGSIVKYEEEIDQIQIESTTRISQVTTTMVQTSEVLAPQPITHPTTYPSTQSTSTTLSNDVSNTISCPTNDSKKLLFVSDVMKCSVYYICYHGKPVPFECSVGLYWSEKHYKCVPREFSECQASSANPYSWCPKSGIDFLPHEDDCRKFWYCRNGFRSLQQCDAFDQWDVNQRRCIRKENSVCYKDLLNIMTV